MHLLAAVSGHGFGHLAQILPVIEALRRRRPGLTVTIRTSLPQAVVAARLAGPFHYLPAELDVGMKMESALAVLPAESMAAYRELHRDWPRRVAQEATLLGAGGYDLLLADVPYLSLAAAAAAGIPAAALCSLHWGDIFDHYCGHLPGAVAIAAEIRAAYAAVPLFLQPRPHMPMADLPNRRSIAPIARRGEVRRGEIDARLGLPPGGRLVVAALGGIPTRLAVERWPRRPGLHWLVPAAWGAEREDCHTLESLALPFSDLLRSTDAVLTKPGYGTFAEAAVNATPTLYLPRDDWPETPYLAAWLGRNGRCDEVTLEELEGGGALDRLEALWARPAPVAERADGAEEAAELLLGFGS